MDPLALIARAVEFARAHPTEVDLAEQLLAKIMGAKSPPDVARAALAAAAKEAIRQP